MYFLLLSQIILKCSPYYRNVVPASQLDAPVLVNGVLNELYDAFKVNETTAYLFEYTFARSQLGKYQKKHTT